ncbi:DsbA family protein [Ciceribacter sp. L1K23]|uniref:DsbA family protein n=1 Tax=Ciceribacter sp. L1K23 TaxID=2820276 RepID=UPI001B838F5A|nr:DsbA family protein [Ciceribacter sp. L1K23]MBR0555960.1 DsbA family protein [Ciceribacter sp. L1K23]
MTTDVAASSPSAFGDQVKNYLLANPEIMLEVQDALERKQDMARQQQASAAIESNGDALFASSHDITVGNPDGDVTIVEFFDYNCGYCKRAMADMDQILATDSNVRFVLKELPILGDASLQAHRVSDAFRKIAPEKYLDFHRALLGSEGRADDAKAIAVAQSLGVSEDDIRKMMAENPSDEAVRESYQLAASLGINGTPSYVVGKEALFGALGAELLQEKVANVRACGATVC